MSTPVVIERIVTSPRRKARIAGLFYLLTCVTGGIAPIASSGIIVGGNPAATAANILGRAALFRLAFAASLIVIACYIAVTALFYDLFKPGNKNLSLLAAFFSLVGCAVQASACVFYVAPFVVLGGAPYLRVFKLEQLQALALMSIEIYGQANSIGLVFFGFYCLLIGYLIFRSTFMPRILGVLMALGGVGWLTFLVPSLATYLWPYNAVPGIVGEGSLTLWLLLMGVNAERWREQARAA